MAGGGGRAPGALLGLVAAVAAGLGALAGVRAIPQEKQLYIDLIEKNYIYGDTRHEVSVYVKVFTNSPFLVCMDLPRSQAEVIDPKYLWIGPDGRNLEGQMYVNLTETGKLMVLGFKESMSGAYTCTLSHKIIETMTQEEREVVEVYKFMVYAYREADHAYQVFVRYTTKRCELPANSQFFEELKKIVNNIISDLTCHITESSYKCHSFKRPKQGLAHQLFVSFQVNPFAPGWGEVCHQVPHDCEDVTNARVQEAKDRIGEFFSKQAYALKHEFQTPPTIHYVENSFSVTPIDSCRPGFGKNDLTHKNCASCCVVCAPGTYSPNSDVTCRICTRPRVKKYGARSC
ncbi:zona pellucida-binding protein 2 isoform X1 [Athene noctua]|uniref:zona pellucida-binding protein 2 isoform X1 n=1 Tax=Athene noctua TaxID=126797 RepID=UPI003EBEA5EE